MWDRTSQVANYSLSFWWQRSLAPDHFHVLCHTRGGDKWLFATLLIIKPKVLLQNDIPPIDEVVCLSSAVQVWLSPFFPQAHCCDEVTGLTYKVSWQGRICKKGQQLQCYWAVITTVLFLQQRFVQFILASACKIMFEHLHFWLVHELILHPTNTTAPFISIFWSSKQ